MGFWDVLAGRTRAKQANLDSLFLVPSAAVALQVSMGFLPTGDGSVCYRAAGFMVRNAPARSADSSR